MRLVLPDALWQRLLDEFERQRPGVERIAFLDGYSNEDCAVVTTLVVPDATCEPGYYDVSADQMHEAGTHFRLFGIRRLAQVHTHGNNELHHSPQDDRMAYSQREGAISIVLPEHATPRPGPLDGIVHLRDIDEWRALTPQKAAAVIAVVPSLLDFRRTTWTASLPATKTAWADAWTRLMGRARSLWPWRSRRK